MIVITLMKTTNSCLIKKIKFNNQQELLLTINENLKLNLKKKLKSNK